MVLYTPLLRDDIFPSEDENYELISYEGRSLFAKRNEQGQLQLMQLLSTDPQDFLNASFTPGSIISQDYIQE